MEQYSNFLSVVFRDENKISVYNSITLQDRYENEVKNLFLRVKLKALQSLYNNDAKIDKNIFKSKNIIKSWDERFEELKIFCDKSVLNEDFKRFISV